MKSHMYSKKYRVEKIEEFHRHNPLYDDMEGNICYLVYLNIGERGWMLYETGAWYDIPHRIHTSVIEDITYTDDQVIVKTQNTRFTFTLIRKE